MGPNPLTPPTPPTPHLFETMDQHQLLQKSSRAGTGTADDPIVIDESDEGGKYNSASVQNDHEYGPLLTLWRAVNSGYGPQGPPGSTLGEVPSASPLCSSLATTVNEICEHQETRVLELDHSEQQQQQKKQNPQKHQQHQNHQKQQNHQQHQNHQQRKKQRALAPKRTQLSVSIPAEAGTEADASENYDFRYLCIIRAVRNGLLSETGAVELLTKVSDMERFEWEMVAVTLGVGGSNFRQGMMI